MQYKNFTVLRTTHSIKRRIFFSLQRESLQKPTNTQTRKLKPNLLLPPTFSFWFFSTFPNRPQKPAMEIQQKLLKFKYHILFSFTLCAFIFSLLVWAPSFLTILAYFWPLFLSTAMFLAAVVFFGKTSASPATDDPGDKAAEGLLDYVAGQPDHNHHHDPVVDSYKTEQKL